MTRVGLIIAAAAAVATLAASGAVSAKTMHYTLAGTGSGVFTNGGPPTPFNNIDFSITAIGDTSTLVNDPGVAIGLRITSASMSALGQTKDILVGTDLYFLVLEGPFTNLVIFGHPPFTSPATFGSPSFAGYDPTTNLGPVPIHYYGNLDPAFADGYEADFSTVTNATFTAAAVPEPATWAAMVIGFGGLGAALRRRCRGRTLATA